MTHGCDTLLSAVILKLRKQMAILTITQGQTPSVFLVE